MAFLMESCGETMVSVESQRSLPAPFLTKTYQLVDDPRTDHIVSWGEDATTFVVWRSPEFARDLLPKYFKHNNFSSFLRQLNTYGFRKIVAERWEFANEFFRKGEKHLLSEIQRRKTTHVAQHYLHPDYNSPTPFYNHEETSRSWLEPPLRPFDGAANTFISAISEDNEMLRRKNSFLLSELAHMKKLYSDIIFFIQNHVSPMSKEQNVVNPRFCRLVEIEPSDNPAAFLSDSREKLSDGTVKLFGVPLQAKKRLFSETASGSP
ncbi:Heat stress transcription factor B-4b [Apostasia shenzhenica]|uniref:Heat stress transcription factor B-4b n=1 Tax=Apostasia shenzhenica TaxID=1088818 RepID=A0A2H9ZXZ6_9ASPA|nr:Heat stress transcription factor B-4b [Apostasia shenzhenica]